MAETDAEQGKALPRKRLTEVKTLRQLLPFYRATEIEDTSVYWLPVESFPLKFRQRDWVLKLLERLTEELKKDKQAVENFLQLKYTRTELNERFVNTMFEYRPMTGMLLAPGQQMPAVPTSLEIKKLTESHGPDGELNLDHLAPDYCVWFAGPGEREQRRDFFGIGGMLLVWLDEGQEPTSPKFDIPNVLRTHPAMKGVDLPGMMQKGQRLQHPFLKRSREVFAAHLPDGPAKRYAPFVLPRLQSRHFLESTPDQRRTWFELFSGYCIESEADRGILLAMRDGEFDERLIKVLEAMREDGEEYPI